ncbi:MAG: response regulator, partial [Prochlorothrix sp.]
MSTVLVVEDSPTQREMISDLLRGSGLDVAIATDGVEAIEQIESNCPDLVVLDIVMPRMVTIQGVTRECGFQARGR